MEKVLNDNKVLAVKLEAENMNNSLSELDAD